MTSTMSGAGIEVLIIAFVLIWLVIALFKCCAKPCAERDEQRRAENQRLRQLREQRVAARRLHQQVAATFQQQATANAPAQAAATTAEPSAPPIDITQSRVDLVKSNLFFRELEHADSVRTLSAVLAAANDRLTTEEEGNVIARTWRAAEGSVRRMVGGPSSHECCICLDGYEAGETVVSAYNTYIYIYTRWPVVAYMGANLLLQSDAQPLS